MAPAALGAAAAAPVEHTMQVSVVVRVRPLLVHETRDQQHCVRVTHPERAGEPSTVELHPDNSTRSKEPPLAFQFGKCYDSLTPHHVFFEREIAQSIPLVLAGANATVLALGASGSGKTFTMEGSTKKDIGMVPRCIQRIFEVAERSCSAFSLDVSYFEICHDCIFDLLVPRTQQTDLALTKQRDGTVSVSGLTRTRIETVRNFDTLYARGRASRRTTRTALNAEASRSHSVVLVHVATADSATSTPRHGTLHLIDLAGCGDMRGLGNSSISSERRTDSSLRRTSVLESILAAQTSEQQRVLAHEPKLTRVLQSALRTSGSAVLVCHIAPLAKTFDTTLETLTFASKASGHSRDSTRSGTTSASINDVQAATVAAPKTPARSSTSAKPRASSSSVAAAASNNTRQTARVTIPAAPRSERPSATPVRTATAPRSVVTPASQSTTRAHATTTPGSMESKLAAWRAAKQQSKLSKSADVQASSSRSAVGRKRPAAVASVSESKRTPPVPAIRVASVSRTPPTSVSTASSRSSTTASRPSTTSSVASTAATTVRRRTSVTQVSPNVRLQASVVTKKKLRQSMAPPSSAKTPVASVSAPSTVRSQPFAPASAPSVPSRQPPPPPSSTAAARSSSAPNARLQTLDNAAPSIASSASRAPTSSVSKSFAHASSTQAITTSATDLLTSTTVQAHTPVVRVASATPAPVHALVMKPRREAATSPGSTSTPTPMQNLPVQESSMPVPASPVRVDPVKPASVASVPSSPSLGPIAVAGKRSVTNAPLSFGASSSTSTAPRASALSNSTMLALSSSTRTTNDAVSATSAPTPAPVPTPTQAPTPKSTVLVCESSTTRVPSAPPLKTPAPKPRVSVGSPAHDKENVTASAANSARLDATAVLVAKQLIALALERERKRRFRTALSLLQRASQMLPTLNAKLEARMELLERACPSGGAAPPQHLTTAAYVQRVLEQDLLTVLNTGSVDELLELHAIGDKRAEKIVAARPFDQLDDLLRVQGITDKVLEKLHAHHTSWANPGVTPSN